MRATAKTISGIHIRPAERGEDMQTIMRFIIELAEYEKAVDQVECDAQDMEHMVFDEGVGEPYIAEVDGEPVGFMIGYLTLSTWVGRPGFYIEDLYVKESERGQGAGKALISFAAHICKERNYPRLEWSCLDWNAPSLGFYKHMGADTMDDWIRHRVTGEALAELAR